MATKILVRRGLKEELTETTLDEGELGFSTDIDTESHELGLYVGSDAVQQGYIKVNSTKNIEYEGNALTSATDSNNLETVVENIDAALKTEQNNVDTLQSDLSDLDQRHEILLDDFQNHTHGTINHNGTLTAAAVTPATGDAITVVDADDNNIKKAIAINTDGTSYLKEDGTWHTPSVEDLDNVVLTDVQNGQVLKYSEGNWVNLGDTDENTKYTFDISDTTWSAPGGASYDGKAITLEASTGSGDDTTIKLIEGSSRMAISKPATGVVVLNSLPRPFTVNENEALDFDEEITLTQGHNIVITEDGGAITIKTADDITLNNVDDINGSWSHNIIFKNKWEQGGQWVVGENKLFVDEFRKLQFWPANDSTKEVLTTETLLYEVFNKENNWLQEQRFDAPIVMRTVSAVGNDPSRAIRFYYESAIDPKSLDLFVTGDGVLTTWNGTTYTAVGGLDQSTVESIVASAVSDKADIDSPTFTGTVTAPTPAQGVNDGVVATRSFVNTAVTNAALGNIDLTLALEWQVVDTYTLTSGSNTTTIEINNTLGGDSGSNFPNLDFVNYDYKVVFKTYAEVEYTSIDGISIGLSNVINPGASHHWHYQGVRNDWSQPVWNEVAIADGNQGTRIETGLDIDNTDAINGKYTNVFLEFIVRASNFQDTGMRTFFVEGSGSMAYVQSGTTSSDYNEAKPGLTSTKFSGIVQGVSSTYPTISLYNLVNGATNAEMAKVQVYRRKR